MEIKTAQKDVRSVFLGGSVGQAVSGILWLISAALGTWVAQKYAIIGLVLGGMLIFPLTQLALKILGKKGSLPKGHPFNMLAMQVAFIVPLCMPVIGGAALYNVNWFYPAFMVVVGAHYLPFMTLYGMWQYGILAAVLIGGGVVIGMYLPKIFTLGGWITGVVLILFAVAAWVLYTREFGGKK